MCQANPYQPLKLLSQISPYPAFSPPPFDPHTHTHTNINTHCIPNFWSHINRCTPKTMFYIRWSLSWPRCPPRPPQHKHSKLGDNLIINDWIQKARKTNTTPWRGRAWQAPTKPMPPFTRVSPQYSKHIKLIPSQQKKRKQKMAQLE